MSIKYRHHRRRRHAAALGTRGITSQQRGRGTHWPRTALYQARPPGGGGGGGAMYTGSRSSASCRFWRSSA